MPSFNLQPSTREAVGDIGLGIRVDRSDLAAVVWAAGPVNLFTITGGQIMMTMLRQEVTVAAVGNQAGTIVYAITTAAPYAVATVDFSTACGAVTNAAIGSTVTVVGTALATAALLQITIGPQLIAKAANLILTPGIVNNRNTGAAVTGLATCTIVTSIWYYPLEDNARVVAS
jgi:hypothetical protein